MSNLSFILGYLLVVIMNWILLNSTMSPHLFNSIWSWIIYIIITLIIESFGWFCLLSFESHDKKYTTTQIVFMVILVNIVSAIFGIILAFLGV